MGDEEPRNPPHEQTEADEGLREAQEGKGYGRGEGEREQILDEGEGEAERTEGT